MGLSMQDFNEAKNNLKVLTYRAIDIYLELKCHTGPWQISKAGLRANSKSIGTGGDCENEVETALSSKKTKGHEIFCQKKIGHEICRKKRMGKDFYV